MIKAQFLAISLPAFVSFLVVFMYLLRLASLRNWKYFFYLLIPRFSKIKSNIPEVLQETSSYYRMLKPADQLIFQKRVQKFIRLKAFIPMNGITVTDEMKVLIASKAIQVTFGYPMVYLSFLDEIYVYPEAYKSETDYYYHGETSTDGHIKLSWKNFLQGEYDQQDGKSLGIHEFSHALHFENHIKNRYYLFINPYYLKALREGYHTLKNEILEFETPIRSYGATNFPEFFAVCVEVYFEQPLELRDYNVELYELLSKILNQDIIAYAERRGFLSAS